MPLMTSTTTSASGSLPRRPRQTTRGKTVERPPTRISVSGPMPLDGRRARVRGCDDRHAVAPGDPARDLAEQVRAGAPALRVGPVAIGEDEDVEGSLQPALSLASGEPRASATNRPVRVGIDGRHLRASARRGVSRYADLLVAELGEQFPDDDWVTVTPGRFARRPLFAAAALTGRPRLDRLAGGCDVAWVPAPAPVAVSAAVPLVLTVHDLSFEHRAEDYGRYERLWHRLARPRETRAPRDAGDR